MTIMGYLTEHWTMLVPLIGMSILLFTDIHLERRMIYRIAFTMIMLFIYSVFCYVETELGNQTEYSSIRPVLCAINYGLVSFILVNIIMIVYPEQGSILLIPAIINTLVCFISVPSGIVFTISSDNHFHRGPLGFITYIVCGLYLAYFIFRLFNSSRRQKEDYPLLIFMSLISIICLVLPLFIYDSALHWFVATIAIDILLYYVYLLQLFTKRDSLTKLLNRQSYYADAEKYMNNITAFIAMDVNGLKEINDIKGHVAGDVALKTVGDCFWRAAQLKQRVYRIGGDEFVILCVNSTEDDVKSLIERIRQEITKTQYTCSIGYSMKKENDTIDKLYHRADVMLYEEKKRFYEITGKDRRRRR